MANDSSLVKSLEIAADALEGAGDGAIVVMGEGDPASAVFPVQGELYEGGLHSHACIEACFVTGGRCRIWQPGFCRVLSAGEALVVPPRTLHCEGWDDPACAYDLLWLALIGDACSAFENSFVPGSGWKGGDSIFVRKTGSALVARAVEGGSAEDSREARYRQMLLRGGMFAILADLLQRVRQPGRAARRKDLVGQVRDYLDRHYAEPISVASLAALFRRSPNYLNSLFSRQHKMGIRGYLIRRRLEAADILLREGGLLVKEAAFRVGFSDPLYFSRLYRRHFGRTPSGRKPRG